MNATVKQINIDLSHGLIEGVYLQSSGKHASPLVVITNGHNGFYNYGMFPHIQEYLSENQISSYSYNFSHGGVRNGNDTFTEIDAYKRNCMRLETADLYGLLSKMRETNILQEYVGRPVILLSHSLGVIPTIFAANEAIRSGISIAGVILMAPIRTLNIFPKSMMEEWESNGVYHLINNRTGQALPQGPEFLEEIKKSDTVWNLEIAIRKLKVPLLAIHGSNDGDVPVEHSESVFSWAKAEDADVELTVVQNAGHTFNTTHPFQEPTNELKAALIKIVSWIHVKSHESDN